MDLYFIILLVLLGQYRIVCCQSKLDDNCNIKSEEILKLFAKENGKTKDQSTTTCWKWKKIFTSISTSFQLDDLQTDLPSEDLINRHKIWSRWGKWGGCSVTCGDGSISRRRLCVAGRCAPGEIEEQHRPCTRTPCGIKSKENIGQEWDFGRIHSQPIWKKKLS